MVAIMCLGNMKSAAFLVWLLQLAYEASQMNNDPHLHRISMQTNLGHHIVDTHSRLKSTALFFTKALNSGSLIVFKVIPSAPGNHWNLVVICVDGGSLSLKEEEGKTGKGCALDCGAGIGRITKRLLLPLFHTVDMVDVTKEFLDKARTYLGEESKRVGNYFCSGLQDFVPESGRYDVIWIQWVIGECQSLPSCCSQA